MLLRIFVQIPHETVAPTITIDASYHQTKWHFRMNTNKHMTRNKEQMSSVGVDCVPYAIHQRTKYLSTNVTAQLLAATYSPVYRNNALHFSIVSTIMVAVFSLIVSVFLIVFGFEVIQVAFSFARQLFV